MSVILEALKKLDRDTLFRRSAGPHIATEILRPDLPLPKKRVPRYLIVISLTALATAALTYTLVGYRFVGKSKSPGPANRLASTQPLAETPSQSSSSPPIKSPMVEPAGAPGTVNPPETLHPSPPLEKTSGPSDSGSQAKRSPPATLSPPGPRQETAPSAGSPEPARAVRNEIDRAVPKIQSPPTTKKVESSAASEEEEIEEEPDLEEEPPPTLAKPANPASLKLSAIVWHDDSSKRIAVINGILANEGSLVLPGIKVEQIFTDRVRLSQEGRVLTSPSDNPLKR